MPHLNQDFWSAGSTPIIPSVLGGPWRKCHEAEPSRGTAGAPPCSFRPPKAAPRAVPEVPSKNGRNKVEFSSVLFINQY